MAKERELISLYSAQLNFAIRSNVTVKNLTIPLIIDIKDVPSSTIGKVQSRFDFIQKDGKVVKLKDDTDSLLQTNYELNDFIDDLRFIYKYIDFELYTLEGEQYKDVFGIYSVEDFIYFGINNRLFTKDDYGFIHAYVIELINEARVQYTKKLIDVFNLHDNPPKIPLGEDDFEIKDDWKSYMGYDYNMISFQIASEYPMDIWFSENIGKGFYDWPWREHETKRVYLTRKNILENFREEVKSYNMKKAQDSVKK